jgi:hypothetical protein
VALTELSIAMFPLAFPQLTRMLTGHVPTDPAFLEARAAATVMSETRQR